jgi:hypothetical protein
VSKRKHFEDQLFASAVSVGVVPLPTVCFCSVGGCGPITRGVWGNGGFIVVMELLHAIQAEEGFYL